MLGASSALVGTCGPFTDVTDAAFCPFVLEIFTLEITTGTTPTTYDPAGHVTRLQMAAFLSRAVDGVLTRGGRRALSKKFWTPQNAQVLGLTTIPTSGGQIVRARSDGTDVWVSDSSDGKVFRVRGSDGRLLETWTGAANAWSIVVAAGAVLVTGVGFGPGSLYRIDPAQAAGSVTTVATNLPGQPFGAVFDGGRIWTANFGSPPSISIVTPGSSLPWSVATVTTGFAGPEGVIYDGSNVWVADTSGGALKKTDPDGVVLQTVSLGFAPRGPVFDGVNIWVTNAEDNAIGVYRASSGAQLAILTGNGLSVPLEGAFDGSRYMATNSSGPGSVSLWKAADLTPLGSFAMPASSGPDGVCSDGLNFWIVLRIPNQLARF